MRTEGMHMAPARAIPRLLARQRLRAQEIGLWEIHEAFSAQVLANVRAASDRGYRREKARVDFDTGAIPPIASTRTAAPSPSDIRLPQLAPAS
jgi:acetyl-CoA C-acetyltransferase